MKREERAARSNADPTQPLRRAAAGRAGAYFAFLAGARRTEITFGGTGFGRERTRWTERAAPPSTGPGRRPWPALPNDWNRLNAITRHGVNLAPLRYKRSVYLDLKVDRAAVARRTMCAPLQGRDADGP